MKKCIQPNSGTFEIALYICTILAFEIFSLGLDFCPQNTSKPPPPEESPIPPPLPLRPPFPLACLCLFRLAPFPPLFPLLFFFFFPSATPFPPSPPSSSSTFTTSPSGASLPSLATHPPKIASRLLGSMPGSNKFSPGPSGVWSTRKRSECHLSLVAPPTAESWVVGDGEAALSATTCDGGVKPNSTSAEARKGCGRERVG